MQTESYSTYYFIGIGGIGMSALARYFNALGKPVAGYDRTQTPLTEKLVEEGISVHYEDNIELIDGQFKDANETLVVYTPAVPKDHSELNFFRNSGFEVQKRAQVLGLLTRNVKGLAVAGTHGKTTVSTMLGHLLYQSHVKTSAIFGGISSNYGSNLLLPETDDEYTVLEADEYDRSLLHLQPFMAVITALDADHLDIYGTKDALKETFTQFVSKIQDGGVLLHKNGIDLALPEGSDERIDVFSYSLNGEADFKAQNIRQEGAFYRFNLKTPDAVLSDLKVGIPGLVNVENAVAAASIAFLAGATADEIREHLTSFKGIKRRFDIQINTDELVYIDDYAHHPEELNAIISSVRSIYPERKITGAFQPHLFTRTRDFVDGFAESLEALDEIILLDIYPAREEPIEGVSSQIIFDRIKKPNKVLIRKEELIEEIEKHEIDVLLTLGAGNIDKYVEPIRESLLKKNCFETS